MVDVSFPWRYSAGGSYKRDTGYSPKSVALHGEPDVVFVNPIEGEWGASRLDTGEGLKGPFFDPDEAMAAADEAWPWTGPREPWWAKQERR